MGISIKGVDNLINKLNKLSTIETKETVMEVANDMSASIKSACPHDTGKAKEEVGLVETRQYANSSYIDVGLSSSKSNWDKIKGAYSNNYGWNSGGKHHGPHIGWFDNAVAKESSKVKAKLKKKLQDEIKAFNGG